MFLNKENIVGLIYSSYFWEIMERIITDNMERIAAVCRKYHVKTLYAFGSATGRGIDGNSFGPDSDIDLLVEYEDIVYDINSPISGFHSLYLERELEALFGCKVDLVGLHALRNKYFIQAIEQSKTIIYAA